MLLTECSFWKIVHVAFKARIQQPVMNSQETVHAKRNLLVRNVNLALIDTMATRIVQVYLKSILVIFFKITPKENVGS